MLTDEQLHEQLQEFDLLDQITTLDLERFRLADDPDSLTLAWRSRTRSKVWALNDGKVELIDLDDLQGERQWRVLAGLRRYVDAAQAALSLIDDRPAETATIVEKVARCCSVTHKHLLHLIRLQGGTP